MSTITSTEPTINYNPQAVENVIQVAAEKALSGMALTATASLVVSMVKNNATFDTDAKVVLKDLLVDQNVIANFQAADMPTKMVTKKVLIKTMAQMDGNLKSVVAAANLLINPALGNMFVLTHVFPEAQKITPDLLAFQPEAFKDVPFWSR